jgi:hypothetical protein
MFNEDLDNYLDSQYILEDLLIDLIDLGLQVDFKSDSKFGGKFYVAISDNNKVLCKDYPRDDMDWLYNKTQISEALNRLKDFGLKRDIDFKVYGGGLGVNLVFEDKDIVKRKYNEN